MMTPNSWKPKRGPCCKSFFGFGADSLRTKVKQIQAQERRAGEKG